jgi:hypothetical protein
MQAPVVKRRSCRITDPVVKVRVLPGARTACSSSGQSAAFTRRRQQVRLLPGRPVPGPRKRGPGRDPGISGGGTRQAPHGRADHVARTPGRKPVASAVQVRLLPRPLTAAAPPAVAPPRQRNLPPSVRSSVAPVRLWAGRRVFRCGLIVPLRKPHKTIHNADATPDSPATRNRVRGPTQARLR